MNRVRIFMVYFTSGAYPSGSIYNATSRPVSGLSLLSSASSRSDRVGTAFQNLHAMVGDHLFPIAWDGLSADDKRTHQYYQGPERCCLK